MNLAYGLSAVSLRDYSLGLIGILPGTVLFCALGALAGDVARFGEVLSGQADGVTWALRIVGVRHLRCGLAGGACGSGLCGARARNRWLGLERQITQGRDQHKPSQPQLGRRPGRLANSLYLARPQSVLIQRSMPCSFMSFERIRG